MDFDGSPSYGHPSTCDSASTLTYSTTSHAPLPYSKSWSASTTRKASGLVSPPDSRGTSDNKDDPAPPRQSLPSIHEALGSASRNNLHGITYASPVSASLLPPYHQPLYSLGPHIPRSYPQNNSTLTRSSSSKSFDEHNDDVQDKGVLFRQVNSSSKALGVCSRYIQTTTEGKLPTSPGELLSLKSSCNEMIEHQQNILRSLTKLKNSAQATTSDAQVTEIRHKDRNLENIEHQLHHQGTVTEGNQLSGLRKRRGRAVPPGRCHSCDREETSEWRRGPNGARTLCNPCGLAYAKLTRKMAMRNHEASSLRPKYTYDHGDIFSSPQNTPIMRSQRSSISPQKLDATASSMTGTHNGNCSCDECQRGSATSREPHFSPEANSATNASSISAGQPSSNTSQSQPTAKSNDACVDTISENASSLVADSITSEEGTDWDEDSET